MPRCRDRWALASHTPWVTHTCPTDWYLSQFAQEKATKHPWGHGVWMSPRTQGQGDGAHWDESSNQVSMRQTRWPGFKANFCQLRGVRRAEGAAQQGVTWHCAQLLVHGVLGRPVLPLGPTTARWESQCRAYSSLYLGSPTVPKQ